MVIPRELLLRAGVSTRRVQVVSDDVVEINRRRVAVHVLPVDESAFIVTVDGARHAVNVAVDGERAWAMAAGEAFEIQPAVTAWARGERADVATATTTGDASSRASNVELAAPMPATVTAVLVQPSDRVAVGQPLVRLEAMKMELVVTATRGGRVATIDCREGDVVQPGRPLLTLADEPAQPRAGRS